MAKKETKKNNSSSKKRKIIIGVVCGIFAAAALGAGLGIGLTKCGPEEPKNKFTIYFTPAPGDTSVEINITEKTVEAGQNFATACKGITATKHTEEGDWDFQWWYKDGDEPTNWIEEDFVLGSDPYVKSLTVHPYFTRPAAKRTVTFSNGGDKDIKFNVDKLQYEVKDGSTLKELLDESKIKATKVIDGKSWFFKHWTLNLEVEEWQKPRDYGEPSPIVGDITLYPYFEEPEEIWKNKTITWETYGISEPQPVSKIFTLPPESEGTTTFTTTISNFVLSYTDSTTLTIPELQNGEEANFSAEITSPEEMYKGVTIDAKLLEPAQDMTPNKLNVEFTFNNIPADNPDVYTTPLIFNVDSSLSFKGVTHSQEKIEGITIEFSDPWDAPKFEFTQTESKVVTFKTNAGSKNYLVSHDDADGHFTISRPLDSREKLEIKAIDENGEELENISAEPHVTIIEEKPYIDVTISFDEIIGIFVEHKANFKLKFITTFEGSGRQESYTIPNNFELVYTPDDRAPYSIVMDDIIVINGDLGENNISAQIENNVFQYFQESHYLTIRNLTREKLIDPDEIDKNAPIYFTTPHEKITNETIGKSEQWALRGNDEAKQNLGFKIQFLDDDNIPSEITPYTVELEFIFWENDPGQDPENPQAAKINSFTREITFIFSPKKWENYTSADWAQYRSILISMSAEEISSGKTVQKLGTAWQLSNISNEEAYYVTAYDVKEDYLTLTDTAKYKNFAFGYSNMGAAKQYVSRDSTKYIMVDSDINSSSDVPQLTTDLLISNHDTQTGEKGIDWVDEDGDEGKYKLYWDSTETGLDDSYAPNIALFKLKPKEHVGVDLYNTLYDQTFRFRPAILNNWAKEEGLDPLHEETTGPGGQVSKLFEAVPDDFSRNGFSYGYTGGFKSKEISYGNKTARVVYWTDYVMYAQIGELTYLSPDMYDNCEGYYDEMFMAGNPEQQVYHYCGAFAMTLDSFRKSNYYDDAGRGAMLLLRKYTSDGKNLESPVIAGINWNGGSIWNWPWNITPYFDVWQYGHALKYNLLATYKNPWA